MSKKKKPEPIPWESVALIGYRDGEPGIISSVEPDCVLSFLLGLGDDEEEDDDDDSYGRDFDRESFIERVNEQANLIEWKLYPVDVAKEIFCSAMDERKKKRKKHEEPTETTKPIPGQLTLPIPHETGG